MLSFVLSWALNQLDKLLVSESLLVVFEAYVLLRHATVFTYCLVKYTCKYLFGKITHRYCLQWSILRSYYI